MVVMLGLETICPDRGHGLLVGVEVGVSVGVREGVNVGVAVRVLVLVLVGVGVGVWQAGHGGLALDLRLTVHA